MPFVNEHAARQTDPSGYARFRRKTLTRGVDAVIGFKKEGGSEIQSLRLDADAFTAAEARTWLDDHGFKTRIEAAIEKSEAAVEKGEAACETCGGTGKIRMGKVTCPECDGTGDVTKANGRLGAELLILEKAEAKRFTLGVVYEPDVLDTQREMAKAEDIERAAWDFMGRLQALAKSGALVLKAARDGEGQVELDDELIKAVGLDDEHMQTDEHLGTIVESYVAPCDMKVGDQTVKKGSWLLGTVWTPEMFAKIRKGDRTGLSMYGRAERISVSIR